MLSTTIKGVDRVVKGSIGRRKGCGSIVQNDSCSIATEDALGEVMWDRVQAVDPREENLSPATHCGAALSTARLRISQGRQAVGGQVGCRQGHMGSSGAAGAAGAE